VHQDDCLPDLTILDGSEPTRPLGGSLFDPRPDRLNDQDVGKTRYDGLATRGSSSASAAMNRSVCESQSTGSKSSS
jgi:hypothetical protein